MILEFYKRLSRYSVKRAACTILFGLNIANLDGALAGFLDPERVQLNSISFTQEFHQGDQLVESRQTVYWVDDSKIDASIEFILKDLEEEGIHGDSVPLFSVADVLLKDRLVNLSTSIRPRNFIDLDSFRRQLAQRNPSSEKDAKLGEFEKYYRDNHGKRSLLFVVSRFLLNSVVSSYGFFAGSIPLHHAIMLGSLTGTLSGTIQVYSSQLNRFVSTNEYGKKLAKRFSDWSSSKDKTKARNLEPEKSDFFFKLVKWGSIEIAFLGIIQFASFCLGEITPNAVFVKVAGGVLLTAAKSVFSQGLWDTSVATETDEKIRKYVAAGDFENASRAKLAAEVSSFGSSMLSVVGAVTDLMGVPIGNYIFGALTIAGAGNHLRLRLKDDNGKFRRKIDQERLRLMRPLLK